MDSLVPENDQQELWELSGMVKAVKAYAKLKEYVSTDEIIVMLGGSVEETGEGDVHEE